MNTNIRPWSPSSVLSYSCSHYIFLSSPIPLSPFLSNAHFFPFTPSSRLLRSTIPIQDAPRPGRTREEHAKIEGDCKDSASLPSQLLRLDSSHCVRGVFMNPKQTRLRETSIREVLPKYSSSADHLACAETTATRLESIPPGKETKDLLWWE
eukprot:Gregarina_sp_Poly_1__1466@NODE_1367_length_4281_cov_300_263170_g915_i0_p5_GENE_NODE_1367_length_4281_cov_300_263170_g915_i0NODE_1367_length_4281_cov_300_263170_g915_i0_p5_ORF_typecomplete_len152_score12_11_NODE_1367_length_4281_cov_300_263170_g915_i010261481